MTLEALFLLDMSEIYPQTLYFVQLPWVAATVRPEHFLMQTDLEKCRPMLCVAQ